MNNHNPNTRALISALRSDYIELRKVAIDIIDKIDRSMPRDPTPWELGAAFRSSPNTARSLMRERALFTKSGRPKRK